MKRSRSKQVSAAPKPRKGTQNKNKTKVPEAEAVSGSAAVCSRKVAPWWTINPTAPPPSIKFSTGEATSPPVDWSSKQAGKDAAQLHERMDVVRLAGTVTLAFDIPRTKVNATMKKLETPIPPFEGKHKKTYKTRPSWNNDGEPPSSGTLPVGSLLNACLDGSLLPHEPSTIELLGSLVSLKSSPWDIPLLRVITPSTKPSPTKADGALLLQVDMHIYIHRLKFYLIACEEIHTLFRHLPTTHVARPTVKRRSTDPTFVMTDGAAPFSLGGLMAAAVNDGYAEADAPSGLKMDLFPFQRQTLGWMQDQEALDGGINSMLWEERRWLDGGSYFYFPLAGELRLETPPTTRGGMLSEEMGLGKTLEMLALILADKQRHWPTVSDAPMPDVLMPDPPLDDESSQPNDSDSDVEGDELCTKGPVRSNSTLIIVPPSLLAQWADECKKVLDPGVLSVCKYSPHKTKLKQAFGAEDTTMHVLSTAGFGETGIVEVNGERIQYTSKTGKTLTGCSRTMATVREPCSHKLGSPVTSGLEVCSHAVGQPDSIANLSPRRLAEVLARFDIVLTTYNTLTTSDQRAFSLIDWRRVVLDECQEVRSSTTQLARVCRQLRSGLRWMVSGTPLHNSIDDLNGELAFLGVWPFCLLDSEDGFWERKVGDPWANKDTDALDLLHQLLKIVMIRHCKAQKTKDGSSILQQLPPAHVAYKSITIDTSLSEHYVYSYIDHHAGEEAAAALAQIENGRRDSLARQGAAANSTRRAEALLRLTRASCTSASLVNLAEANTLLRAAATAGRLSMMNSGSIAIGPGDVDSILERMVPMDISQAMLRLMSSRTRTSADSDFVSHGAAQNAWRGTGRSYAAQTHEERLTDALKRAAAVLEEAALGPRAPAHPSFAAAPCVQYIGSLRGELEKLMEMRVKSDEWREHELVAARSCRDKTLAAMQRLLLRAMPATAEEIKKWQRTKSKGKSKTKDSEDADDPDEVGWTIPKEARSVLKKQVEALTEAYEQSASPTHEQLFDLCGKLEQISQAEWLRHAEAVNGATHDLFTTWATSPLAIPQATVQSLIDKPRPTAPNAGASADARKKHTEQLRKWEERYGYWLCSEEKRSKLDERQRYAPFQRMVVRLLAQSADLKLLDLVQEWFTVRKEADDERSAVVNRIQVELKKQQDERMQRCRTLAERTMQLSAQLMSSLSSQLSRLRWHLALELVSGGKMPSCACCRRRLSARFARRCLLSTLLSIKARPQDEKDRRKRKAADATESDVTMQRDWRAQGPGVRLTSCSVDGYHHNPAQSMAIMHSSYNIEIFGRMDNPRPAHVACERLSEHIKTVSANLSCYANQSAAILPYVRLLVASIGTRVQVDNYDIVEQSGFQALNDMAEGRKPTCCICHAPTTDRVAVTRCMHIACAKCCVTWYSVAPAMQNSTFHRNRNSVPCPICRQPFTLDDLIAIEISKPAPLPPPDSAPDHFTPASMDVDPPVTSNDGKPAFVRASVASDYESVPLPPDVTLRRDGKYPALCTDGGRFLAHRSIAASRRSPKVEALLDDLRKVLPQDRKALVFSQLKDSLLLISKVLVEEGIEHVKIVPGDSVIDRETAAERFRTDPKVQVFLLHAGQAAAGLTLTVARHVFLLEPFLSLGDEAQARSRCHRIGQTREVYSTTYYCKGTIEERLLAYRSMQESRDNVIDLTDEDDVTENLAAHTSAPSPAKMKFLFGLRSASDAPSAQSTSSGRRQSRMSVPAASRRGRAQRLAIPRHRRAGRMGTCSVVRSSSSSEDDSELSDSE